MTSHVETSPPEDEAGDDLFVFRIGEHWLALPSEIVDGVTLDRSTTPVPYAPAGVRGMMYERGRVYTLFDSDTLFATEATEDYPLLLTFRGGDSQLALQIHEARGVFRVEATDDSHAIPVNGETLNLPAFEINGDTIVVLAPELIVTHHEDAA